jgi:hypothetical protein
MSMFFVKRRTWIWAIAVFISNPAIGAMNNRFALMFFRKLLRPLRRLSLGIVKRIRFLGALSLYRPFLPFRYNMVIFLSHFQFPSSFFYG